MKFVLGPTCLDSIPKLAHKIRPWPLSIESIIKIHICSTQITACCFNRQTVTPQDLLSCGTMRGWMCGNGQGKAPLGIPWLQSSRQYVFEPKRCLVWIQNINICGFGGKKMTAQECVRKPGICVRKMRKNFLIAWVVVYCVVRPSWLSYSLAFPSPHEGCNCTWKILNNVHFWDVSNTKNR